MPARATTTGAVGLAVLVDLIEAVGAIGAGTDGRLGQAPPATEVPAFASTVDLVVMDDAGFGLDGAAAARKAATQFLSEATRPGDLVSLGTAIGDAGSSKPCPRPSTP